MNKLLTDGFNVVGIDISAIPLKKAKINSNRTKLIQADINYLPFRDNTFNLVYNIGVIEHFFKPIIPLTEMKRVTKIDGTILVGIPNKYNLWNLGRSVKEIFGKLHISNGWKYGYEKPYTKKELYALFNFLGMKNVKIFGFGIFEGFYIPIYFITNKFPFLISLLSPLLFNDTSSLWGKILKIFTEKIEKVERLALINIAIMNP